MTHASDRPQGCDVAVVIPTSNRARLLDQAIRSVRVQRGVSVELVVVDDGSTDETPQVLARVPDVTLVRHDASQTVSVARNAGAAASTAPILAFLDDDDLWAPWKLERQIGALRDRGIDWVTTGSITIDADHRIVRWHRPPDGSDLERQLLSVNSVPGGGSGVAIRRSAFDALGGFDESLSIVEDWDLWVRLAARSPPASVDGPAVAWRRHPGNTSRHVDEVEREYQLFVDRYALRREELDVEVDWGGVYQTFAALRRDNGEALAALRRYATAARRGNVASSLVRSLTVLPGGRRLADARAVRSLPAAWRSDAEGWLASIVSRAECLAPEAR